MTKRNPVSTIKPIWTDAQEVSDADLKADQTYNDALQSSNIVNHIGTGIIPAVLQQKPIFDADLSVGFLDGKPILAQNQPSDNILGNQLEISLKKSLAAGKRNVKVAIIGLDFESKLRYETFVFKTNEIQVSKKHFTQILSILFNDFKGNPLYSMNLGGELTIKEAKSFFISRDVLSVSQDIEPNLFFRDFFLDGFLSLQTMLQTALPFYDVDTLQIFTGVKNTYSLIKNDVVTQIGQKFVSTSDNIQKVSLLLSVQADVGNPADLVWNGEIIVSLYELQNSVSCPSDLAPDLDIEFSPSNIPLSQVSLNYNSLLDQGYMLDTVPQPIDFLFTNTPLANKGGIKKSAYYAITIKRSGSANKCDILLSAGGDRILNSRMTTFTGTLWIDLPEEDLWFQVWSDSIKISDGQAYENGHGIIIEKVATDVATQASVDFSMSSIDFDGNGVYTALVSSNINETEIVADQRTGDPVATRSQYNPLVELITGLELLNVKRISDPLLVGSVSDKNVKLIDNDQISFPVNLHSASFVNNEIVIKIIDDNTDSRIDSLVTGLVANLVKGYFVGAKIINPSDSSKPYRVADATLSSMIIGDVNGDGIIDELDLVELNSLMGYNLNSSPADLSVVTTNGTSTTFSNGYKALTKPFFTESGLAFQVVNGMGAVIASASDGYLLPSTQDLSMAQFGSSSVNFGLISNLTNYKLVFISPSVPQNKGGFQIVSRTGGTLSLKKALLSGDTICKMMRADIDGDFYLTSNDGYLLSNYIDRGVLGTVPIPPFPAPTTNAYNKIGTTFNVVRLVLENFIDRKDDYSATPSTRGSDIHASPDIFGSISPAPPSTPLQNRDFYATPFGFTVQRGLVWEENFVIIESNQRLVSSTFESPSATESDCALLGVLDTKYERFSPIDIGKNDYFLPGDLILNKSTQLKTVDGDYYKIDFEVGTIVMEVPDGLYGTEQSINLMDSFVSDYTGNGITRLGFEAMRFSDCSYAGVDALDKNQVRFSVSVQSFSPNVDGITPELYEGVIVDPKIGVSIDYTTGMLSLNFSNLYEDSVLKTLNTKVQVQVFLKKAGFNNDPLFVDSTKIQNMLNLVSGYSGSGINNLVNYGGGFTAAGDLTGTTTSQTVVRLQGRPLSNSTPTINQVLQWNGTSWVPATVAGGGGSAPDATTLIKGIVQLAGDMGGTSAIPRVLKINGNSIAATVPTLGQVLTWDVSNKWVPAAPSGGGGGSAPDADGATKGIIQLAGDLAGTAALPVVAKVNGVTINNTPAPAAGLVLTAISSSVAEWSAPSAGAITKVQDGANYSNTFNVVGYANNANTSSNSYVAGSTFEFDKSSFKSAGTGTRTIALKIIVETTAPQMSIRLFNVTSGTVVTGSTLTTLSTSPVVVTTGDIAANLDTGSAIYQVQIKMDTGANPDRVSLDYAGLKIVWS